MSPFFEKLEALDMEWTLALNGSGLFSDSFWLTMSSSKAWIPLYVAAAALMVWKLGWKRGLMMIGASALMVLCADQFANLIKETACRLRPSSDPRMVDAGIRILQRPGRHIYGFFSAHSSNSLGFALCLSSALLEFKGRKWPRFLSLSISLGVILWAVLVGVSRVFCAKHFVGDVIVGFAVGILFSRILCFLTLKLSEKLCKFEAREI